MPTKFPWKQNLLKVPRSIEAKLSGLKSPDVVVAALKRITEADIKKGYYRHLGIKVTAEGVEFESPVLPDPRVGRWSKTNLEGKEVTRDDLPKYTKTFAVESPNWGDASTYGTHTNYFDREVYPRDFIPPKHLVIRIDVMDQEQSKSGPVYVIRFVVDEVLTVVAGDFRDDLLYNLNILQENVGVADVFASDTSWDQYRATVVVDWEILPVGKREENLKKILAGVRSNNLKGVVRQRYEVLERLKPTAIIRGAGGFQRYFGAQFADDLVVFENIEHGNAIYVMFEDWKKLSKRSRLELLKGKRDGFERIVHTPGWEKQLEFVVKQHRGT